MYTNSDKKRNSVLDAGFWPGSTCLLALCFLLTTGCKNEGTKPSPAESVQAPQTHARAMAAKPSAKKPALVKPAAQGLDGEGRMQISEGDRCPVCGMRVAKHKKFASAIELDDGTAYYFCGTGCMIKSWMHPEIFVGRDKTTLGRAVTPEYFGGEYVDALSVRWVAGSDVVGPMGPALVPLKDDADLRTFEKRHGGKTRFRLADMDDAKWKAIMGKDATMRPPQPQNR